MFDTAGIVYMFHPSLFLSVDAAVVDGFIRTPFGIFVLISFNPFCFGVCQCTNIIDIFEFRLEISKLYFPPLYSLHNLSHSFLSTPRSSVSELIRI
jgi:hypothetical protein